MRILIWTKHPGDVFGEVIDFLTHGEAQHAGFLRQNGLIHEAYTPRVRDRKPTQAELPFIRIFKLRGVDNMPIIESVFEREFDKALPPNAPVDYSIEDLFRFLFNKPAPREDKTFCSRYVLHTIQQILHPDFWPLIRCEDDDWVSPRDLFISNLLVPDTETKLITT